MAQKMRSEKTETIDNVNEDVAEALQTGEAPDAMKDAEAPVTESPDAAEDAATQEASPAKAPARGRRSRRKKSDKSAKPEAEGTENPAEGNTKPDKAEKTERGERAEKPARPAGREARSDPKPARQSRSAATKAAPAKPAKTQMCISYIPGEECRVAVVEDAKLEEFHAERASNISRVGNIYVGRVTNVEPAIQAAFVDFGVDHHGFLHVSDVHPRYFPGEDDETTESVGKKTPRRERPPVQRCFRRGDEVVVQVLKEGVGTKGPTLTSYLSVPGRFLVMMPQMDKVGVSRKVEDEDQRREMRKILDQLDLPEGFGFILRTAGMERTKQELKRDLAYLLRLWKDMEGRRGTGNKPRLLYSESDLLVRALRDMLAPEIDEVIIDNELALARAARFLKIVAPRSKVRLLQYAGQTPLFHAFGIEQQIALMHAREVPLPGGGRLVIDETEALVAIDVNSGKMRDARDAETNAYRTNCEAVEEICRQLKLRDLGGIVINDLIDMRLASHRKDVEQRFRDRLKRDRARSTTLPISNFGILEMTRQRMRGSHETVHFGDCPTCRGRGIVQKPDSVASDSLRNLAALLDHDNVARVEMVVSPRVASELLSSRRKTLNKLERASGKHVDVRVSETIPIDRITFYAYDGAGADIDVELLPKSRPPRDLQVWELPRTADDEAWASDLKEEETSDEPELTPAEQAELVDLPTHPIEVEDGDIEAGEDGAQANGEGGRKRRRRRRRRGRGDGTENGDAAPGRAEAKTSPQVAAKAATATEAKEAPEPQDSEPSAAGEAGSDTGEPGEAGRRRRRRRRRRRGGQSAGSPPGAEGATDQDESGEAGPAEADVEEIPIDDLEAPRGDSWDLPPAALPRLTPTPAAAKTPPEPAAEAPTASGKASVEPDVAAEPGALAEEDEVAANAEPKPGKTSETTEGRGRRRRRGRGGQRDGDRKDEPKAEAKPVEKAPATQRAKREPAASAPKPQENARIRTGGGYQRKSDRRVPAARSPASEPKPAASPRSQSPPPPAAQPPAPGSGQPAKPKRVLYTSRRKLTPAELAKRPKPE